MTAIRTLTTLFPLMLAAASPALASEGSFEAGNRAASRGDHAAAAVAFERALVEDGWSPGALFDLGNAYAAADQRGRAILAFERAQLLAPRDPAIAGNLARQRELAGLTPPEEGRLHAAVARLTADEWTWIALGAGLVTALGVVARAWAIRRRAAGMVAVASSVVAVLAVGAAGEVAPDPDRAIVVAPEVARIAPFDAAEEAFSPVPGEAVEIEQARGDRVYVRDGDRAGWLPRRALERVVPDRSASPT